MEQILLEMFEHARKLVVETDRKLAEENDRIREKEREAKLLELSTQIEAAFDFTSKEKLELDPRLDIQDGKPTVEFIVRSLRAIFVLSPQPEGHWTLNALEDGRSPSSLGEFQGGTKSDAASRRLAAARIVTAIGNWAQKGQPLPAKNRCNRKHRAAGKTPRHRSKCRSAANPPTALWASFWAIRFWFGSCSLSRRNSARQTFSPAGEM